MLIWYSGRVAEMKEYVKWNGGDANQGLDGEGSQADGGVDTGLYGVADVRRTTGLLK